MGGAGPTIKIEQLGDDPTNTGRFKKNVDPDSLYLDIDMVEDFEATTPGSQLADAFSFFVGVTVLHEYVHYGDYNYNGDTWIYPDEEGFLFEEAVYGNSVWIIDGEIVYIKMN